MTGVSRQASGEEERVGWVGYGGVPGGASSGLVKCCCGPRVMLPGRFPAGPIRKHSPPSSTPLLRDSSDGHNRDDIPSKPDRKEIQNRRVSEGRRLHKRVTVERTFTSVVLECNFEALC